MGQREVIKALAVERKCNNEAFLSAKDIEKALINLGCIVRKENISKSIRKIKKLNIIETKKEKKKGKGYRLKKGYENAYI